MSHSHELRNFRLALILVWLPEGYASHDLCPAPYGASFHCQGRSLFGPLDSPGDMGGSLHIRGNNFNRQPRVANLQLL